LINNRLDFSPLRLAAFDIFLRSTAQTLRKKARDEKFSTGEENVNFIASREEKAVYKLKTIISLASERGL
jgi:hypothetical protein